VLISGEPRVIQHGFLPGGEQFPAPSSGGAPPLRLNFLIDFLCDRSGPTAPSGGDGDDGDGGHDGGDGGHDGGDGGDGDGGHDGRDGGHDGGDGGDGDEHVR